MRQAAAAHVAHRLNSQGIPARVVPGSGRGSGILVGLAAGRELLWLADRASGIGAVVLDGDRRVAHVPCTAVTTSWTPDQVAETLAEIARSDGAWPAAPPARASGQNHPRSNSRVVVA